MSSRNGPIVYAKPFIRIVTKLAAAKGLNLDELAQRADIRRSRMTRYERSTREPLIDDIFNVAAVLSVSPLWLFKKVVTEGDAARASALRSRRTRKKGAPKSSDGLQIEPTPFAFSVARISPGGIFAVRK
jgi:transcriptional regulator with XRE-family HTH domain